METAVLNLLVKKCPTKVTVEQRLEGKKPCKYQVEMQTASSFGYKCAGGGEKSIFYTPGLCFSSSSMQMTEQQKGNQSQQFEEKEHIFMLKKIEKSKGSEHIDF